MSSGLVVPINKSRAQFLLDEPLFKDPKVDAIPATGPTDANTNAIADWANRIEDTAATIVGDVNAKAATIAANTAAINVNDGRITVNEGDITAAEARITINEADILDHEGRIAANEAAIVDHEARISALEAALPPTIQTGAPHVASFTATAGTIHVYDASGGAFTITAPASPTNGQTFGVVNVDLTSSAMTFDSGTAATIRNPIDGTEAAIEIFGAAAMSVIWNYSSNLDRWLVI